MKKELILFKIVIQKPITPSFIDVNFHRKFPNNHLEFFKLSEEFVSVVFVPDKKMDKQKFIQYNLVKLKKEYNAYSVIEMGELQQQIAK